VLKSDGNGAFSDLLRAYDHLVANGRSLGIRVINLSLSGSGNPSDEECQYISQLTAQGMTVVTAAGKLLCRYISNTVVMIYEGHDVAGVDVAVAVIVAIMTLSGGAQIKAAGRKSFF
jgi:O-acetyl-ADP-ribose deacetylase (regulator of RNase III)